MERVTAAEVGRLVERRAPSGAPLERLAAAVAVVEELRDVGEEVLDRFVGEARAAHCSWAEVGAVLGVTRQAAQQRFPAGSGPLRGGPDGVSDTVRAAMVVAQEEARALGHNYVGTEHLVLGLLAETEGLASDVLRGLGITREALLARTREFIGTAAPRRWEALGVAPRLKRSLELARAEARRLGHRCAGTEHVLLGIVRLDEAVATRLLRELGAPPERIRAEVAARLGISPSELAAPPRRRARLLRRQPT